MHFLLHHRMYVEFGVENGTQCNTRRLLEEQGFNGLLMDGSNYNDTINLKKEYITVDNILDLFNKYNVPSNFDMLSVDLDMFDWWVLERILNSGAYRPRMIVVEVNPTLGHWADTDDDMFRHFNSLPLSVTHPHHINQTHWDHSRYFGANPQAFQMLGQKYDYEMIYCESCGVNCFLIHKALLPPSCRPSPPHRVHRPCYFHSKKDESIAYGHAPDLLKRRPLQLTRELLSSDTSALTAQDMVDIVLATDYDQTGSLQHTETRNIGVFATVHLLLLLITVRYCCGSSCAYSGVDK